MDDASLAYWEANVGAHEYGMSLLKPGASCSEVTHKINDFFAERNLLQYRSFGYGHSFGVLSHYYGREAGLELREDIDTVLEPGMVISMEPMITIPEGQPGAGGYREHDILIITEDGAENITGYPYGPRLQHRGLKRGGCPPYTGRTPPVHPLYGRNGICTAGLVACCEMVVSWSEKCLSR